MSRKLKVKELRDELSKRGLDTKGLKAALVARLDEAIASQNKSVNAAPDDDKAVLSEIVTDDSKATCKMKAPRDGQSINGSVAKQIKREDMSVDELKEASTALGLSVAGSKATLHDDVVPSAHLSAQTTWFVV